jgi:hypothetical protein
VVCPDNHSGVCELIKRLEKERTVDPTSVWGGSLDGRVRLVEEVNEWSQLRVLTVLISESFEIVVTRSNRNLTKVVEKRIVRPLGLLEATSVDSRDQDGSQIAFLVLVVNSDGRH